MAYPPQIEVTTRRHPEERRQENRLIAGVMAFFVFLVLPVGIVLAIWQPWESPAIPDFYHDDERAVSCWMDGYGIVCIPDNELDPESHLDATGTRREMADQTFTIDGSGVTSTDWVVVNRPD